MPTKIIETIVSDQEQAIRDNYESKLVNHVRLLNEAIEKADRYQEELAMEKLARQQDAIGFSKKIQEAQEKITLAERLLERARSTKYHSLAEASKEIKKQADEILCLKKANDTLGWKLRDSQTLSLNFAKEKLYFENEILNAKAENEKLIQEIYRIKREHAEIHERFKRSAGASSEEMKSLKDELDIINGDFKNLTESIKRKDEEISRLKNVQLKFDEIKASHDALSDEIAEKANYIGVLEGKIKNILSDMDELQNKIHPKKIIQTRIVEIGEA